MGPLLIETRAWQAGLIALANLLLAASPAQFVQPCHGQLDQSALRFVGEVLTRNEYGLRRDDVCRKWVTAPTLSTFGPRSHHPTLVANVVRQLNECLPENRQIKVLQKADDAATLKIYFIPLKDFDKVASQHEFNIEETNYGFFRIAWNQRYEIEQAVVLIAEDRLRGNALHHMVLEEVAQALGPTGDSNRFPESVFLRESADGQTRQNDPIEQA